MEMANQILVVDDLPKDAWSVHIVLGRPLRFRIWLATKLIEIATWLLNGKTEVTVR